MVYLWPNHFVKPFELKSKVENVFLLNAQAFSNDFANDELQYWTQRSEVFAYFSSQVGMISGDVGVMRTCWGGVEYHYVKYMW